MGVVVNTVHNVRSTANQNRFDINTNSTQIIKSVKAQAAYNFDLSGKTCPLLSEMTNIGEGGAQGDFAKICFNGGLLSLYILPFANGGDPKIGIK